MKLSKDRSDLESTIMALGHTADDLRVLAEVILDGQLIYDEDRLHTALIGLAELVDARFEKSFDTYKQVFELDEYSLRARAWRGDHE